MNKINTMFNMTKTFNMMGGYGPYEGYVHINDEKVRDCLMQAYFYMILGNKDLLGIKCMNKYYELYAKLNEEQQNLVIEEISKITGNELEEEISEETPKMKLKGMKRYE